MRRLQRGFAMVTVVFLLVIVAAVVGALAALRERGSHATALDVRQARATQAARAALEWAAWKVLDPSGTGTPGATALPPCFASPATVTLPSTLAEFAVTVTCVRAPSISDVPPHYSEDARLLAVYTLEAVATSGEDGAPDGVKRKVQMRVETCKDPASTAANFAC
jgi:MSHA biogenesis protein MshP